MKSAGRGDELAAGEVLAARVNGDVITLREVKQLGEHAGLSPERALERLVQERLLAQYAEQRGYGELPSVGMELKRARVRSLLERAVEAGTGPESISRQQIERTFELRRGQLPEAQRQAAKLEDDEPLLRDQLVRETRRAKLEALVKELIDGTKIVYDEPAIRRAFTDEGAAGTGT